MAVATLSRMRLAYGLLGPLTVVRHGLPVPIRAMKPRTVLAFLLLCADQHVTAAQLADELWGESPPASARANLRTYIGRLRRALVDPVIVGSGGGYRLVLAGAEFDVTAFRALVRDGRSALAAGAAARALPLLERALATWRGEPLADIDAGPVVLQHAGQLADERVLAFEDAMEARLVLGRHADVIPAMRAHVATHPLRERAQGQLMIALYRSGDIGSALAVYARARSSLRDELGMEPGNELRRIQHAVLTRDPALGVPADRAGSVRSTPPDPVPRQLPPAPAVLVGRAEAYARIREVAHGPTVPGRPALVAIHGGAGVGKSALAIAAAHELADRYPDGQLYLDLLGASPGLAPVPVGTALGRLLTALGTAPAAIPADSTEAAILYRSLTAVQRLLIVLDNAAGAAQVEPLLPAAGTCLVLVTSRPALTTVDGGVLVALRPVTDEDAQLLLRHLVGTDRVAAEPAATALAVRLSERLPLALRVLGARLASQPGRSIGELVERLSDERRRLDLLELPELGVRSSLRVSHDLLGRSGSRLDAASARAFRLLAVLSTPTFGPDVVHALLAGPAEPVADRPDPDAVIHHLAALHLIEPAEAPARWRMHDLLRLLGTELAHEDPADEVCAALDRANAYYAGTARCAVGLVRPGVRSPAGAADPPPAQFTDAADAVSWLDRELPNLLAVARRAAEDPRTARVPVDLLRALSAYLPPRGGWGDFAELAELAHRAAALGADPRELALALMACGLASHRGGDIDGAVRLVGEALALREAIGDLAAAGASHDLLGTIYYELGHPVVAIACYARALRLHRRFDRLQHVGTTLHNLGEAFDLLGRPAAAIRFLRRSLRMRVAIGDRLGEARTRVVLGRLLAGSGPGRGRAWTGSPGEPDEGRLLLAEGIAIARAVRHREAEWEGMVYHAEFQRRSGESNSAFETLRGAHQLALQLGWRYPEAVVLRLLAKVHLGLGDQATAAACQADADAIGYRVGIPALEAFLADPLAAGPERVSAQAGRSGA